jgi:hypothetical protein
MNGMRSKVLSWTRALVLVTCALLFVAPVAAQSATAARSFPTAEAAVQALVAAVKAGDRKAMLAILGPGSSTWLGSGDAVADKAAAENFVASFDKRHGLAPEGDGRVTLEVGDDRWPFAFPLERTANGWRFDTAAGKHEMLARRIGANEINTINVMLAFVDAEREFASSDRDGDGVPEYARRFLSSKGKRDGLYFPTRPDEPPSPLGPQVVRAASEGYGKAAGPAAYHGYHFRILTAQGKHATGGSLDYIVRGRMIGGFAAIAWPAKYGNSGIMTFIVNHDGVVYQKDLGADTANAAAAIRRFDPGPGWTPVPSP